MKKILSLIFVITTGMSVLFSQSTDLEKEGYKGAVKKVDYYNSTNDLYSSSFYSRSGMNTKYICFYGDWSSEDLNIDSTIYHHDKEDRLINEFYYSHNPEENRSTIYKFDENDLLIKTIYNHASIDREIINDFEYNDAGHETLNLEVGRGRTNRLITEYDDTNRVIKRILQYGDEDDMSEPSYVELFDYDDENHRIEYNKYSPRNDNKHIDRTIYLFDEEDNKIETQYYVPQTFFSTILPTSDTKEVPEKPNSIIRYDYLDNVTRTHVYNENNELTREVLVEYGNNGSIVKRTIIYEDGSTSIETYAYDEDNNLIEEGVYYHNIKKSNAKVLRTSTYSLTGQVLEVTNQLLKGKKKVIIKNYYDQHDNLIKKERRRKRKLEMTERYEITYY